MQHSILNNTDNYLIRCRGRNNRDMERTLRSFIKKLYTREAIPLDGVIYPDHLINDLRNLGHIAIRLLDQLESHDSAGVQIRQLELNFVGA